MPDIADAIHSYAYPNNNDSRYLKVYIEKVGTYVPGNSGPAAAKFARHCGHIEALLYAFQLDAIEVTANKWMKGIGTWPKDKAQRKRAIKEAMQKRYARCKVTLATSDALGILTYALQQESSL